MSRPLRNDLFLPQDVSVCHVVQQCVRHMPLLGVDETTGKDYSYRREWIRQRLEKLASVFAVDVLAYTILSNHYHVVLRNRPDIVNAWSDKEVALRWMQIFQGKRFQERLESPTTADVQALANDGDKLEVVRSRLSDLSWFMKTLAEPIARMANLEEKLTGPFWEGGFKAQRLLDEVGLLACCMFVELNPVRIAVANSIRESTFTSAFDRLRASQGKMIESSAVTMKSITHQLAEDTRKRPAKDKRPKVLQDAWLAPLTLHSDKRGPVASKAGYRSSDKGFLNMTYENYFELLEFTSRQGRTDKRGKVKSAGESEATPSINAVFSRLGIADGMWCDLVWNFKKYYGRSRAVGSPERMTQDALSQNLAFQPGQGSVTRCFATKV